MGTVTFYNAYKKRLLDGNVNHGSDTIKAMFVTSSYTPDVDAHDFIDDVSANEVSASGTYSAGGVTLANKAVTQDNTDNEGMFDFDDISVTGFTGAVRYVVYYKDTGTPATSPLICYDDLGSNVTATAGTWAYAVAAEGLINTA